MLTMEDASFVVLPPSVRYVVRFAYHVAGAYEPMQCFTTKRDADRWAMVTMRSLPAAYTNHTGFPKWWALVVAMPDGVRVPSYCPNAGFVYLAVDNGGKVAKRQEIPAGYHGHRPVKSYSAVL